MVNEMNLEEVNGVLYRIQCWQEDKKPQQEFPRIKITLKKKMWSNFEAGAATKWRSFQCDIAQLFIESIEKTADSLHDLAHSGMLHALNMIDKNRCIGPCYSDQNQTGLLSLADKAVMFAIMIWPGTAQKYHREIEQRVEKVSQLRSVWESHIGSPTA